MDRRHFLLTSLASAAPAQLFAPAAAEPHGPTSQIGPPPDYAHAEMLWAVTNDLELVTSVVEGYSQLLLREMDQADPLRRCPETMLRAAEHLRGSRSTCAP